ncbi:hypothetical protein NEF87_002816 [Candidatus Lokiarchaeum ossiferum]|uniref:GTP-binding protein n=1 Tax=Candidatus Lokiarchaeum ossiferum TaxID=2951803 RepID=A0ABY6HVA8_9ARCH|nr:hypothetical protein NEF87_002816 [Candidatus Lokiarchaeum sp. B-35]
MVIQKKILFAGLDNSGKSSIILSFQKKFSFMNSTPTMGLERSNITTSSLLGLKFVAWDMGGQGRFRKRYLEKKYHMFTNTSVLFYIIDITDSNRFKESLDYYLKILDNFILLDENPQIVVCFHKNDPDIKEDPNILENIVFLSTKITAISKKFSCSINQTSIHDISTIYKLFSEGVMKSSPVSQMISAQLKAYTKITSSLAVLILSNDMLTIGNHSNHNHLLQICEKIGPRFLYTMSEIEELKFSSQNLILNVNYDIIEKNSSVNKHSAILFMQSFDIPEGEVLNIVTLAKNTRTYQLSQNYLPILASQISNILNIST